MCIRDRAVREQNVMFHELVSLSYDYRNKRLEYMQLKQRWERKVRWKWWPHFDVFGCEQLQIEVERTAFQLANMARIARDRIREIVEWHRIKAELLPSMKHGIDDVNKHQAEALPIRFERAVRTVTPHTPPADAQNIIGLHITAQRLKQEQLEDR
jgi:hypothetical protein